MTDRVLREYSGAFADCKEEAIEMCEEENADLMRT